MSTLQSVDIIVNGLFFDSFRPLQLRIPHKKTNFHKQMTAEAEQKRKKTISITKNYLTEQTNAIQQFNNQLFHAFFYNSQRNIMPYDTVY